MKKKFFFTSICMLLFQVISAQVILEADGTTDTYDLINSVFANANRNVVEVPDCNHTSFGKHITQIFDTELNKNVFQFHIHVSPDNDRCKAGVDDRQRNEIKTYGDSPENIKADEGETVQYKWKFKLSDTFKPTSSFTHIHQIKSVDGPYASIPMISFTLRKSNPDRLELRHTSTTNQTTLKSANLDLFRGNWVSVLETIKYSNSGSYSLEIKNIATNQVILSYTNNSIDNWQDGASFARPKWGIYRSLNNKQDLQDEIVKFADFSIEENPSTLSVDIDVKTLKEKAENILLYPNPSSKEVEFKNANSDNYNSIEMYDFSGRKITIEKRLNNEKLDVSNLSKGLYFIVFKKDTITAKVLKCYVK
ncbi:T9SS type A sorting domain-containing protein [Polaribacter haliotis]|uniref:T9SS type A sorting domain-containing protein n=1 Tax=Polaribacter haliotis TaxID=1888915 RepID=A0A7L8AG23_9FLAO|nr:T9SS type A sorting domain-containing protein [Polaribacter haliotis]QOD60961.1 T9SS type A sorting domain-containing protein [Polaribacter haliotis]